MMVNNGSGSMMVMMYFAIGIGMGGYEFDFGGAHKYTRGLANQAVIYTYICIMYIYMLLIDNIYNWHTYIYICRINFIYPTNI